MQRLQEGGSIFGKSEPFASHKLPIQGAAGGMDKRTAAWSAFLDSEQGVCVATRIGIQALPFSAQAFTVYPEFPTPQLFVQCTLPGSALLFFEENEQDKVETFETLVKRRVKVVGFSNDEAEDQDPS
jgi:hypothetical protein